MLRTVQLALLLVGVVAFGWLLAATGLDRLWEQALRLGVLGTLAIVALGGAELAGHALAWRHCFPSEARPGLVSLLRAHVAGHAVSMTTPTATAGGELVRATLLPLAAPEAGGASTTRSAAVASIAVDRLTYAISDALLGACGVAVLLGATQLDATLRYGLAAGTALVISGIGLFALLQRGGRLVGLLTERSVLARLLGSAGAAELREAGRVVDARIAELHREGRGALLSSTVLHGAANAAGLLQLACLTVFTGVDASWADLLRVFVVVTAIDLASFFVPGRVGAQEGARMLAVSMVGLPVELGLVFSLAQRLEQIVWVAVGLALYSGSLSPGTEASPPV